MSDSPAVHFRFQILKEIAGGMRSDQSLKEAY